MERGVKFTGGILVLLLHLAWLILPIQLFLSFMIKPSMRIADENRLYYVENGDDLDGVLFKRDGTMDILLYGKPTREYRGYAHISQRRFTSQKYYQMFFPIYKYSNFSKPTRIFFKDWRILKNGEQAYYIQASEYDSRSKNMIIREKEVVKERWGALIVGDDYIVFGGEKMPRQNALPDWAEKIMPLGVEIAQMPTPEERVPLPNPIRYTDAYP